MNQMNNSSMNYPIHLNLHHYLNYLALNHHLLSLSF